MTMLDVRLSAEDELNLTVESPGAPTNVAAVAILDDGGRLSTDELRAAVAARLPAVPRLRQVPLLPGRFGGRPRWIAAPRFRIDEHVRMVRFSGPGGDEALLRLAAELVTQPLDRSRPLWRMWLVPGLPGGRTGLIIVLHHVITDGLAAIQMVTSLLGAPAPSPLTSAPPQEAPRRGAPDALRMLVRSWRAPRSTLNAPVGPHRRLAVLRLDLAATKTVAHRHGGTVNAVVLTLAAGGVRALLRERGAALETPPVTASVAVSLRTPGTAAPPGNRTGGFVVRLPVGEPDPAVRLRRLAPETAGAKNAPGVTAGNALLVGLARLGLVRWMSSHQRLVQVVESDMIGPSGPVTMLGVPVSDVVAIGSLTGNVALSIVAFSYAGRLNVTVHADADAFPDLPVLVAGIRHDWALLNG
jgi:diacylglycerol O-acyltransferase